MRAGQAASGRRRSRDAVERGAVELAAEGVGHGLADGAGRVKATGCVHHGLRHGGQCTKQVLGAFGTAHGRARAMATD